jgi:transposase-like protein
MPNGPTDESLADELGVGYSTISRWKREYREAAQVKKKQSRPQDRPAEEKLRLVMEASQLDEEQLGAFLRREGIHEDHLHQWKRTILEVLQPGEHDATRQEQRKIAALQKELRRKDKALAEAGALLVLQKKVRALLGEKDDNTEDESDL